VSRDSAVLSNPDGVMTQRILVLGATGMLGHKLTERLSRKFPTFATVRQAASPDSRAALAAFRDARLLFDVDAGEPDAIARALDVAEPTVVINAIGIIKQIEAANDAISQITINALLPHRIAAACRQAGGAIRSIHFSTDCVFSGRAGPYAQTDAPDPQDLYGRTKLIGEVDGRNCLTIRSSLVGRELRGRSSLIEWFLSQRGGRVRGFTGALYTGLTTNAMADLVAKIIVDVPQLDGIWQVASTPISKFELLGIVNREFSLGIEIERDESFRCDRRLDGGAFAARTGFKAAPWDTMIAEMRADPIPYD